MSPLYVKDASRQKQPRAAEGTMCRDGFPNQQRPHGVCSDTVPNFPPIAESGRMSSPGTRRRGSRERRARPSRYDSQDEQADGQRDEGTSQPLPHRWAMNCPSRPRSNSDFSLGDVWSSGRRSIGSSNGRSSVSFSSGDASTVASAERLRRRTRLSPRRVCQAGRPVTPFPGAEEPAQTRLPSPGNQAESKAGLITAQPPTAAAGKSARSQHITQQLRRRKTGLTAPLTEPTMVDEPRKASAPSRTRRTGPGPVPEEGLPSDLQPRPPSPLRDCSPGDPTTNNNPSDRPRRRKSLPDLCHQRPARGEGRTSKATDAEGKRTAPGTRVLTDIMDRVTRDRIVHWLTEVAHAKDEDQQIALQEALTAIDEE